jgi:hypothetical protein
MKRGNKPDEELEHAQLWMLLLMLLSMIVVSLAYLAVQDQRTFSRPTAVEHIWRNCDVFEAS